MQQTTELLMKSLLGAELSEQEAATLAGLMSDRTLSDGDVLLSEGTVDNALHVVLDGKLEVVRQDAGASEVTLAVLREGDLAGELSFIDGVPHTVSLRALCEARIVSLQREDLEKIVTSEPELVYKVMRAIVRSTHKIVHRMNHQFVELNNYIFKQHGRY